MSVADGQSTSHEPRDFAQAYQEFKTHYENELRRQDIVGSSFFLIRENQVIAKEVY